MPEGLKCHDLHSSSLQFMLEHLKFQSLDQWILIELSRLVRAPRILGESAGADKNPPTPATPCVPCGGAGAAASLAIPVCPARSMIYVIFIYWIKHFLSKNYVFYSSIFNIDIYFQNHAT